MFIYQTLYSLISFVAMPRPPARIDDLEMKVNELQAELVATKDVVDLLRLSVHALLDRDRDSSRGTEPHLPSVSSCWSSIYASFAAARDYVLSH